MHAMPLLVALLAPGPIDWANQTYPVNDGQYTLENGELVRQDDDFSESLTLGPVLSGDIDGDRQPEYVVPLQYWGGGTGRFDELIIYRVSGDRPLPVARIPGGDRADGGHDGIRIEGEWVVVDRLGAMPWQGACCPTFKVSEYWRWSDGGMVRDMTRSRVTPIDLETRTTYDAALAEARKAMGSADRDFQGAIEALQQALSAKPKDPVALGELGFAMLVGKVPQAEDVLWGAANAEGPAKVRAAALYNLAKMYAERGAKHMAIDAARRSLVLRPGNAATEKLLAGLIGK